MTKVHHYTTALSWTGNLGTGTSAYERYSRNHEIGAAGKAALLASSDPAFRGDPRRYSPEELLLSALSGCHMLWYLHLCAIRHVVVTHYTDEATGVLQENADGSGQFSSVTLRPRVMVTEKSMISMARSLHDDAHRMCFIARSVNFPIEHLPEINCHQRE